MSVNPDATTQGPGIARPWIKANVIGAVVTTVSTFVPFVIGRVLGVNEPDTSPALAQVFSLICIASVASGLALFGFLLGVVLRQKIWAFPMRAWVGLYLLFGIVLGAFSAYSWMGGDPTPPAPARDDVSGVYLGAILTGGLLGAVAGSLQALVLRRAAQGLSTWIWYSALSGTTFLLIMPVALYGPQDAILSELVAEAASFVAAVVSAVIMLPAVLRLEPR